MTNNLEDIYNISQFNENLEDFLFDFIKLIMIVDVGLEAVYKGYSSYENIKFFKKQIKKGINKSQIYNTDYARVINVILGNKHIMSYVDTTLYNELDNIIYNKKGKKK